jgi:hypothetical protein
VLKFRKFLLSAGAAVFAVVVVSLLVTGPSTASAVSPAAVPVTARYSPLGATANGPSGPATARFTVGPHCCPSSAVILTPTVVSTENDFQWLHLGLPWDNTSVTLVQVCYAVTPAAAAGRTYISQTRISDMTMPNSALVRLDDGTDRTAVGPGCYTVPASFTPTGAMTLGLKVVIGNMGDRITVGLISLSGLSE